MNFSSDSRAHAEINGNYIRAMIISPNSYYVRDGERGRESVGRVTIVISSATQFSSTRHA